MGRLSLKEPCCRKPALLGKEETEYKCVSAKARVLLQPKDKCKLISMASTQDSFLLIVAFLFLEFQGFEEKRLGAFIL